MEGGGEGGSKQGRDRVIACCNASETGNETKLSSVSILLRLLLYHPPTPHAHASCISISNREKTRPIPTGPETQTGAKVTPRSIHKIMCIKTLSGKRTAMRLNVAEF